MPTRLRYVLINMLVYQVREDYLVTRIDFVCKLVQASMKRIYCSKLSESSDLFAKKPALRS